MNRATIAHRAVDCANEHDAAGLASRYAEDATFIDPSYPEPLRGRDAIRQDFQDLFTAFPDARIELGTVVAAGNAVAYQIVLHGTHDGPLATPDGPVPPTGRKIELRACHFVRLDDTGLIRHDHRYFDLASLLGQLGLV